MRVLIADKFEQSGIEKLEDAGCEVLAQPGLKDEALWSVSGPTCWWCDPRKSAKPYWRPAR